MYNKAAELGTIPDEMNPIFLFAITHSQLLLRIVVGEVDVFALAKMELENRGYEIPDVELKTARDQGEKARLKKSASKKGKKL